MEFRTQIPIQKQEDNVIDYHAKIVLLGSCFSENIGGKFEYYKFQSVVNPFGILFHPKAIETFIERVVTQNHYTETDVIFHNERYHCFDAHSNLSHSNKEALLSNLNEILEATYQYLVESTHLIITLGTAWVYEHIHRQQTVANCHKIPQKEFNKKILSVQGITDCLKNIEQLVRSINTDIQLIYTVSPVRHIKDGFVNNQQSKAHLLSAIHHVIKETDASYFPSYEIMMDDLRDYRFYKSDMLHPNKIAVEYIWQKFKESWLCDTTSATMKQVAVVQNGLAHKPFNPESEKHQVFLKHLDDKKKVLLEAFPFMEF